MTSHFYHATACNAMHSIAMRMLSICPSIHLSAWWKSIRRIWNLPWQAHGYLLPLLVCLCTMSCVWELWILYARVLHITTPWLLLLHDMALCTVALALLSVVICYAAHSDIHALWSTCSVVTPYVVLLNCVFASVWLLTRYEQLI